MTRVPSRLRLRTGQDDPVLRLRPPIDLHLGPPQVERLGFVPDDRGDGLERDPRRRNPAAHVPASAKASSRLGRTGTPPYPVEKVRTWHARHSKTRLCPHEPAFT